MPISENVVNETPAPFFYSFVVSPTEGTVALTMEGTRAGSGPPRGGRSREVYPVEWFRKPF
jgi:hypothetical protein